MTWNDVALVAIWIFGIAYAVFATVQARHRVRAHAQTQLDAASFQGAQLSIQLLTEQIEYLRKELSYVREEATRLREELAKARELITELKDEIFGLRKREE